MIKKYYDQDCNLGIFDGKTVGIIGFGSQGHAHANNLKESGVNVVVGLRADSRSAQSAKDAGLEVVEIEKGSKSSGVSIPPPTVKGIKICRATLSRTSENISLPSTMAIFLHLIHK